MKTLMISILYIISLPLMAGELKIITQNLQCKEKDRLARVLLLKSQIQELGADVVFLQEDCRMGGKKTSELLRNLLGKDGWTHDILETHIAYGQYQEGLAVLSRKKHSETKSGLLPSSVIQRGYLAIKVDDLWLINTHLAYRKEDGHTRYLQSKAIHDNFDGEKFIIGGDFNNDPLEAEYAWLRHRLHWYFPGSTYHDEEEALDLRLDGFWATSPIHNSRLIGTIGSDHRGVLLNAVY